MNRTLLKNIVAFTLIVLVTSCGKKNETSVSKKITPPSPALEQKFTELAINNPQDSFSFKLPNGTIIEIPQSAFVDASGKPVTEKVALKYKEYKDAVDILGSGIPMEYDSAGVEQILQTAGMFEMYGFDTSGQPVFIHPDKKINVSMQSPTNDSNYNFYVFDTINGNWKYIDRSIITDRSIPSKSDSSTIPGMPVAPLKYDPNGFVLDIKISSAEFSEFASMKGLMWQYAGEVSDDKENPKMNKWVFKRNWSDIKLEVIDREKSLFRLTLSDPIKCFKTTVSPVIAGKEYDRAMKMYKEKYETYSKLYADRILKDKQQDLNRRLIYRTVGISNFGRYNHDRIMSSSNSRIAANFELENGEKLKNVIVYHMYGGAATVIKYPTEKWNSFAFTNQGGNCLVVFLENGKMATYSNNEFIKLDDKKIAADKNYTFKMKTSSNALDSEALRKMLKL
jgi:hypothetical protein